MNKTKRNVSIAIFIALSALACAGIASAAPYTPLVRIPGLPAAGPVDLSMYMIGLYNFLLSIVGIVAVMMLIFGGMRYITAMGSSSAISSAKDIVTSALFGLLLALISWVIVSTINPDILYIKNPTSKLPPSTAGVRDVACTKSNSPCVCNNNTPPVGPPPATPDTCSDLCRKENRCAFTPADSTTCIAIGANNQGVADTSGVLQCNCVNGVVVAKGAAVTCNAACLPANCLVADLRMGVFTNEEVMSLSLDEQRRRSSLEGTRTAPIYISDIRTCSLLFEAKLFSVVGNKLPAITYSWDADLDITTGPNGYDPFVNQEFIFACFPVFKYVDVPGATCVADIDCKCGCTPPDPDCWDLLPNCFYQATPKSLICQQRAKITDGTGASKEDNLYFGWLAPSLNDVVGCSL